MNTPLSPRKTTQFSGSLSLHWQAAFLSILLAGSIPAASASTIEWDKTKTGTVAWGTASNWVGGVTPSAGSDVKVSGIAVSSTLTNVSSFKTLLFESGGASVTLSTGTASAFAAESISIKGVNGLANFTAGNRTTAFVVSGTILVEGDGGNIGRFSSSRQTTVQAAAMILGGSGTTSRAANLTIVGPQTGETLTFDIPTVTFNNGSSFTDSAAWTGGTVRFTGDVLLQEGAYNGRAASFSVGRAGVTGNVQIDGNLTLNSGEVVLRSAVNTDIGKDITIGAGARVYVGGTESASALNRFSAGDSLTIKTSGTLDLSDDLGGLQLRIGKNFVVETNSTVKLGTGGSLTTVQLGGNLDIKATSLKDSNFNTMQLALSGTGVQTLEAAVTDSDTTFALDLLKLNGSSILLEDNTLNIASGEYFRTNRLENIGESTINLNGARFFVGSTLQNGVFLAPGVYTEFGGTLTVIPEPSTAWLLALTGAGAALVGRSFRRRF